MMYATEWSIEILCMNGYKNRTITDVSNHVTWYENWHDIAYECKGVIWD